MDRSSDNAKFPALCLVFVEGSRLFFSQFSNILQKLSTKKKTVMIHFFMLGYLFFTLNIYHNSTLFFFKTNQTTGFFVSLILNSYFKHVNLVTDLAMVYHHEFGNLLTQQTSERKH